MKNKIILLFLIFFALFFFSCTSIDVYEQTVKILREADLNQKFRHKTSLEVVQVIDIYTDKDNRVGDLNEDMFYKVKTKQGIKVFTRLKFGLHP